MSREDLATTDTPPPSQVQRTAGAPASADAAAGWCALAAAAMFVAVSAGLALTPRSLWFEYIGVPFHLALLPLVARLPAPTAAKAMGYAWIAIDTIVSVVMINGQDHALAFAFRLGGHVLAATWIAATAWRARGLPRWLGWATALMLGPHSLIAAHYTPPVLLIAAGPLMIAWLVSLGIELLKNSR